MHNVQVGAIILSPEGWSRVSPGLISLLVAIAVLGAAVVLFFAWMLEFNFSFRNPGSREDIPRLGEILKGCGPFEMGQGDRAVMLVHGIAGSPAQVRTLGEFLAGEGLKVYAPLLPGHGTHHSNLYFIGWREWYDHVVVEYQRLCKLHSEVYVIGFSLGAALSLRLAAEFPVKKLVVISTPLYWFSDRLPLYNLLRIFRYFARNSRAFPKKLPETVDGPEYMIYKRVPLDALWAVVELSWEVQARLKDISSPTLILHSRRDIAARPRGARKVYQQISSCVRRLVWLHKTRHGVMHGSTEERDLLQRELRDFLIKEGSVASRREHETSSTSS
jgi:carboxylesterase